IPDGQLAALFEPYLSIVLNKYAMAGSYTNRAAVRCPYLVKGLVQRVPDDSFDRTESNQMIVQAETQYFAHLLSYSTRNHLLTRFDSIESSIDESTHRRHTHAARVIAHEHMLVPIDAHDDDAVVAQLLDIEVDRDEHVFVRDNARG